MKNILKLCLFISFHSMYPSVLHQAIRHIPKSEAASHATRETSHRNLYDYAMRYQSYILTGNGDPELFNLITKETLENGFKPFNLLAKDVRRILELLKISLFKGEDIIASPLSTLPDFVMKDYVNIVYDVADNWEKYIKEYFIKGSEEHLSYSLGENKNIRHGIADLICKDKNLKYSYVPKTYKNMEQQIKNTMIEFLDFFNRYELLEDIQNGAIGEKTEGIIVSASDDFNNNQILKDIFSKNPKLKLVLIFDDTLKSTPHHFFSVNNFVKSLVICGSSITRIEDNFLNYCTKLEKLDLSLLSNATNIGDYFLHHCSALQELDLSPLSKVTSIGDGFLSDCSGLQALDLSPLSNLTNTKSYFLSRCSGFKVLDLTPLSKVTSIGNFFLSGCSGLQALDLSPLSNVISIGNFFLSSCSGLQTLDLRPLSNVTSIGVNLLSSCSGLKEVIIDKKQTLININPKIIKITPSVLHEAIQHIPKSEAASHATKEIYLNDYARRYENYIQTGKGDLKLFDLITDETLKGGFQPFNLSADDVKKIASFVQENLLDNNFILESPLSELPNFLMNYYINIAYHVADNWEKYENMHYRNLLGKNKNIRHGVADFMYQTNNWKYVYIPKLYSDDGKNKKIQEIVTKFINFFNNRYIFFDNIPNNSIPSNIQNIQGIITDAEEMFSNEQRINIIFKKNPHLTLIGIVEDSYNGINSFTPKNLIIQKLILCGSNVKFIGNSFLSDSSGLKVLDLTPLSKVTKIGSNFLAHCSGLQKLDLSPLSNITSIEDSFLSGCSGLTALDLRPLSNVTSIEGGFLERCSRLEELDLTPLSNVTSIGGGFLSGCLRLKKLDLTQLSKLISIDSQWFLFDCVGLKELNLSLFSKITRIGEYFLSGCTGLEQLDLSPLSQVTSIDRSFLSACSGLKTIDLSPLSKVTSIGFRFLWGCSSLKEIDLSPLSNITTIEHDFLFGCSGLQALDLSPLSKVTRIGDNILSNCSGLKTLNLTSLSNVTTIGNYFLSNCSSLKELDLSPLSNLRNIGSNFLYNCSNLKKLIINNNQEKVARNSSDSRYLRQLFLRIETKIVN